MQRQKFVTETINLKEFPVVPEDATGNDVLILGDLNGNVVLLIWQLLRHRRIAMSKADYDSLVRLFSLMDFYCKYFRCCEYGIHLDDLKRESKNDKKKLRKINARIKKNENEIQLFQDSYKDIFNEEFGQVGDDDLRVGTEEFLKLLKRINRLGTGLVILLGDDVFDRCGNDGWMFECYTALCAIHVNLKVLHSNHGLLSHRLFETDELPEDFFPPLCHMSAHNMVTLINNDALDWEHIKEIRKRDYLPLLYLLSYVLENEDPADLGIVICMHAPVGFRTLKALAQCYDVSYSLTSIYHMANMINEINYAFRSLHVDTDTVYKSFKKENVAESFHNSPPFTAPLTRLLFTRENYESNGDPMPCRVNGFRVTFVHGHHTFFQTHPKYLPYVHSLNPTVARNVGEYQGQCSFFRSTGRSFLFPEEIPPAPVEDSTSPQVTVSAVESSQKPPSSSHSNKRVKR